MRFSPLIVALMEIARPLKLVKLPGGGVGVGVAVGVGVTLGVGVGVMVGVGVTVGVGVGVMPPHRTRMNAE